MTIAVVMRVLPQNYHVSRIQILLPVYIYSTIGELQFRIQAGALIYFVKCYAVKS